MPEKYYLELNTLNAEIQSLQEKRAELINKAHFESNEDIKKLEWTRNCFAYLEISGLVAAGLPAYTIRVSGAKIPQSIRSIVVMGCDPLYQYNITYRTQDGFGFFETSSADILIEFIKKVDFFEFEYNEKHLEILEEARAARNRADKG